LNKVLNFPRFGKSISLNEVYYLFPYFYLFKSVISGRDVTTISNILHMGCLVGGLLENLK